MLFYLKHNKPFSSAIFSNLSITIIMLRVFVLLEFTL